jgi:ABC-2 type transport system ATP-binding protein
LVTALAPRPRFLILDEPTAGLDPKMRRQFVAKVREARALFAPAVLLASHVMRDVEELADEIAFIEAGRIKLRQSRSELRDWHVIEGCCGGKLPFAARDAIVNSDGAGVGFKLLTASRDTAVEQLRACEANVTNIYSPDLEELYDWIISPRP